MHTEGSLFRLAVRVTGLIMTVIWAPAFFAAALSWFGSAQGWQAAAPEWKESAATSWDWLIFLLKEGFALAIGLYLLIDGRMVIEGLYPSLKARGPTTGDAAPNSDPAR